MTSTHDLQPVKASLIADLVGLININLADLLQVKARACFDCDGTGMCGDPDDAGASTLATCATCGGIGAVEQFTFDMARMKSVQFGRLVEGWDVKQGQIVPKMRSKDKAFAVLVKLLGFDKAILEIANAAPFTESIPDEQRAAYVEQLKELASLGLLDART
jgi:hypothetical protein